MHDTGYILEILQIMFLTLNIYGTDACFKVHMNHCVKSIPCKKRMMCALAADIDTPLPTY
jgi:hypothetical protein